jgi:hypothetical protein
VSNKNGGNLKRLVGEPVRASRPTADLQVEAVESRLPLGRIVGMPYSFPANRPRSKTGTHVAIRGGPEPADHRLPRVAPTSATFWHVGGPMAPVATLVAVGATGTNTRNLARTTRLSFPLRLPPRGRLAPAAEPNKRPPFAHIWRTSRPAAAGLLVVPVQRPGRNGRGRSATTADSLPNSPHLVRKSVALGEPNSKPVNSKSPTVNGPACARRRFRAAQNPNFSIALA